MCILLQPSCLGLCSLQRGQGGSPRQGGDLPTLGQLFVPRDPDAVSGRSPPSPAWLGLLCSLTYFLPLFLAVCLLSGSQNPTKTSPGSNPELTETPRVGMVMVPIMQGPAQSAGALLPAQGLKPSKPCSFSIEEGEDSSANKALPLAVLLESSGCSNPITAHRVRPRDQQEFLALLAACEQICFHLAKWALGS